MIVLESDTSSLKLQFSYVGQVAPEEILLRLVEGDIEIPPCCFWIPPRL